MGLGYIHQFTQLGTYISVSPYYGSLTRANQRLDNQNYNLIDEGFSSNDFGIAAMGGSAGAHLSLWVGLHDDFARPEAEDPIERLSSRLSCVVDFAGPVDMLRFDPGAMKRLGARGQDMSMIFPAKFGYDLARSRDQQDPEIIDAMKQCSPINFVSADDPPVLVRHHAPQSIASTDHSPVPWTINDPHSYWYGVLLADALERAGVEVERHIGPNTGRDGANAARVAEFVIRHLSGRH